jgi:phosphoribosylaminoimidazole-succinocarboxamide synthase
VTIEKAPTESEFGIGTFEFSDDYSVFDYGKMPDTIPAKGESLCRMASWNFQQLAKIGVKSHFLGLVPPNRMDVSVVRILHPGKDEITTSTGNYLIPLEVIFRNSLPSGSSVFKAFDSGELTPGDLGLDHKPEPGEKLDKPIIDITTKLEVSDRRVKWDEAKKMSGLTDDDVEKIKQLVLKINSFLTERANSIGLEHADGKVELAMSPDRELTLVDVCGTLDENRFLVDNFHISKQVIRDIYKKTKWYPELEDAKKTRPKNEWPVPERLPAELVDAVSNMYKAACEMWTGQTIWDASLPESISTIKKFL